MGKRTTADLFRLLMLHFRPSRSYIQAYRRLCTRSPGLLEFQSWEHFVVAPLLDAGMPTELSRRLFVACDVRGDGLLGLEDFLGALTVITAGKPDERALLLYFCYAGPTGSAVRGVNQMQQWNGMFT